MEKFPCDESKAMICGNGETKEEIQESCITQKKTATKDLIGMALFLVKNNCTVFSLVLVVLHCYIPILVVLHCYGMNCM